MQKVLVIDDQSEIIDMVDYMLTEGGYTVVGAQTGEQGLELAREFRPDLILCDIMMPGMDGYDILKKTRRDPELATTPFVFLTAKTAPEEQRAGMELGADDYLTKPFTEEELLAAVETQLEKYATLQERYQQQLDLLRHGLSTTLPREMRAPLTHILAHASLLIEGYNSLDQTTVLESLHAIKDAGEHLNRLLENLMIYVALEGDKTLHLEHPRTSNVKEVVLEIALDTADAHQRRGDLRVHLTEGAARMHAFHLEKIVEELVDNAFKFSKDGAPVEVTLSHEGETLQLQVADRGQGMSDEHIQNIDVFVQFNRDNIEQQGSGLGLTVAKRLIELYSGTLTIESTPSEGTTVHVRIPNIWASQEQDMFND